MNSSSTIDFSASPAAAHPRYDEHKESGVDWLGDVPAHWDVLSLKYAAQIVSDKLDEKPEDLPYLGLEHIEPETGRLIKEEPSEDVSSTVRHFEEKDVLFSKLRPYLAKVYLAETEGVGTTELIALRSREEVCERYLAYQLLSKGFIDKVNSMTYGAKMPRASPEQVGSRQIALPSIDEQRAIATYLDRETERIDALIEKKERLIDLLEEKRTALISRIVTEGLDEDVEMQDSGVEWLGKIPAQWEIISLGYCLDNITYGFTNPMPAADDGPYMLTANDIGNGEIKHESARHTTQEAFEERLTDKSRPLQGDILLTKDGTLGRVAVYDGRVACVNQSVAVLRPDNDVVNTNFLQHLLRSHSYHDMMLFDSGGSTIQHIYITRLAKMPIALPPLDEQRSIASYATQKRESINSLIERAEEGLDQLKEYRTALISAAVTGQIDVREEVGTAPVG